MRYVIVWIVLAAVVVVGAVMASGWRADRQFARHGVRVNATVIGLYPKKQYPVMYSYKANGSIYENMGTSQPPNPPLKGLKVNQQVVAYYNPDRPGTSMLGDPKVKLRNDTILIVLAAVLFPTLVVVRAYFRSKSSKKTK